MSSDIPWTAYGGLLLSALLPIIGGSFDSLSLPKKLKREARANGPKEEQEEEDDIDIERIRSEDAWLFPIIGSAVLFSLFLAFKYLDKKLINQLLGAYFAFVGTAAVARVVIASTKFTVGATRWRRWNVWRLALSRDGKESLRTPKFSAIHLTAIAFAVGITLYQQLVRDHWTTSNLVALSLAFNAVNLLRLDSFGTGSALLGGLFLYDIFWVFGTEILTGTSVMVSVATNFEAPVKVQFPKSLGAYSGFTLLGLGGMLSL
ncbi:minor histocompatibility antigen H13 [Pseudohyphozyma bogoriensis]|nr:minor histocompatibility antigen H13 [Pseudohyphozyma bogoriensis]